MIQNKNDIYNEHLPWLDGLRGIAASWVLLSHVQILSGLRSLPLLSWGSLAVDLFMILSGFLMAHHYILRRKHEPWNTLNTFFTFWVRRSFRIAPLYYVLLFFSLLLGPYLGECRTIIALAWPSTATPIERYIDISVENILVHISFLFGFCPYYSFRTALPDWSIGLEMQFYLAFPFIMLSIKLFGSIKFGLLLISICVLMQWLYPDYFTQFVMPSFLPIKLYVFLVGILIATSREQSTMRMGFLFALFITIFGSLIEKNLVLLTVRIFMVILMFYLLDNGTLPASNLIRRWIGKSRVFLSSKVAVFLGQTSYAVYLLHLIIVLPVAGNLAKFYSYQMLNPFYRFAICFLISAPIIYTLSWILFKSIERKGIEVGKNILNRFWTNH